MYTFVECNFIYFTQVNRSTQIALCERILQFNIFIPSINRKVEFKTLESLQNIRHIRKIGLVCILEGLLIYVLL